MRKPSPRVELECQKCGDKFAGKRGSKHCYDCKDELRRIRARERYHRKKNELQKTS